MDSGHPARKFGPVPETLTLWRNGNSRSRRVIFHIPNLVRGSSLLHRIVPCLRPDLVVDLFSQDIHNHIGEGRIIHGAGEYSWFWSMRSVNLPSTASSNTY